MASESCGEAGDSVRRCEAGDGGGGGERRGWEGGEGWRRTEERREGERVGDRRRGREEGRMSGQHSRRSHFRHLPRTCSMRSWNC